MSRLTFIYLSMAVIFGVGLWGILRLGIRLQAPPYMGGKWVEQTDSDAPLKLRIAQSGVFVQLEIEGSTMSRYKLSDRSQDAQNVSATLDAPGLEPINVLLEHAQTVLTLDPMQGRAVTFVRDTPTPATP